MVHRRVLALGDDARVLLPIARSLGRRDVRVEVAGCPASEYCRRSRYVDAVRPLPPLDAPRDQWQAELDALCRHEEYDLVVPATENYVFRCQQVYGGSSPGPPLGMCSQSAFDTFSDKAKTYELAAKYGICVPTTIAIHNAADVEKLPDATRWPGVLKPASSWQADQLREKHFVRMVNSRSELRAWVTEAGDAFPASLFQCFVPGKGVGIGFLADGGELLTTLQHVRLHETSGHGSTYRMSVSCDGPLVDAIAKLVAATDYRGVGMVEFRVDDETGEWVLIEVNCRFWGSLALAVAAGCDFPYQLYQLLVEGRRSFPTDYRVGVRCRSLFADFRWYFNRLRNNQWGATSRVSRTPGWQINPRSNREVLSDLCHAVTFRDYIDSFSLDDPLPAVAEAALIAQSAMRKIAFSARPQRQQPCLD